MADVRRNYYNIPATKFKTSAISRQGRLANLYAL